MSSFIKCITVTLKRILTVGIKSENFILYHDKLGTVENCLFQKETALILNVLLSFLVQVTLLSINILPVLQHSLLCVYILSNDSY